MKNLFYILSLVAIAAGAYFSNATKAALQEQVDFRVEMIDRNRKVTKDADSTEEELKSEKNKLTDAEKARAEVEASISKLESDEQTLKRELGEIEAEIEEQQEKLQAAADALAEVEKALRELGFSGDVDFDNIQDKIRELDDKRKTLIAEIEELDLAIEKNTETVAKNREEISRLADRKAERDRRIAANARESMVTAVDSNWGFVVIGAGSNSGFEPQGNLIVKRDGRAIAEIKPSSIEANQTIAEILFDTMAPGTVIQPGDRVMPVKPAGN